MLVMPSERWDNGHQSNMQIDQFNTVEVNILSLKKNYALTLLYSTCLLDIMCRFVCVFAVGCSYSFCMMQPRNSESYISDFIFKNAFITRIFSIMLPCFCTLIYKYKSVIVMQIYFFRFRQLLLITF
jgi:hypothetical protein